jgi:hypothetical protein
MRGLDPITRADFQQLSESRLEEAATLLANGHAAGAYYLAGYAVECGVAQSMEQKSGIRV